MFNPLSLDVVGADETGLENVVTVVGGVKLLVLEWELEAVGFKQTQLIV